MNTKPGKHVNPLLIGETGGLGYCQEASTKAGISSVPCSHKVTADNLTRFLANASYRKFHLSPDIVTVTRHIEGCQERRKKFVYNTIPNIHNESSEAAKSLTKILLSTIIDS